MSSLTLRKYRTINNAERHYLHNHHHHQCERCRQGDHQQSRWSGYPRLGFAHHEPPPIVILFVESLDGRLSLGFGVHLDEAESLAASRVTV